MVFQFLVLSAHIHDRPIHKYYKRRTGDCFSRQFAFPIITDPALYVPYANPQLNSQIFENYWYLKTKKAYYLHYCKYIICKCQGANLQFIRMCVKSLTEGKTHAYAHTHTKTHQTPTLECANTTKSRVKLYVKL